MDKQKVDCFAFWPTAMSVSKRPGVAVVYWGYASVLPCGVLPLGPVVPNLSKSQVAGGMGGRGRGKENADSSSKLPEGDGERSCVCRLPAVKLSDL